VNDSFDLFEHADFDEGSSDRHPSGRQPSGNRPDHPRKGGDPSPPPQDQPGLHNRSDEADPLDHLDPVAERARFDKLIDAVLDGAVPHDALGRADAPGTAWRDLATLRMTTDALRSPVEVPDQTALILAAVHRRRGFLPVRLLAKVSAVRGSIAAGLLVALGLYAFSERMGLGVQMRGEVEPFSQLTASLPHDASRVLDDLRSWNQQTIGARSTAALVSGPTMEPLHLHPRSVRESLASRTASTEGIGTDSVGGTVQSSHQQVAGGVYLLSGGKTVFSDTSTYSTIADAYASRSVLGASAHMLTPDQSLRISSSAARSTLGAQVTPRTGPQDADAYGSVVRNSVTINPAAGAVFQVAPGSLEAWSLSTSRRISNFNTSSSSGVTRQIESAPNSDPLR
jgi:hypothetical protein